MNESVTSHCDFCVELANPDHSVFAERLPGCTRIGVWSGTGFEVLPTLGPLTFGHTLVVPTGHVTSFAGLDRDRARQAHDVISATREHLAMHFGPTVAFEHGSSSAGSSGGCGIVHAHVHIVPMKEVRCPDLLGVEWFEVTGSRAAKKWPLDDYLYFSPNDGSHFIAEVQTIPSQLLRAWVGERLGIADWDWREDARLSDAKSFLNWMSRHPLPLPTIV